MVLVWMKGCVLVHPLVNHNMLRASASTSKSQYVNYTDIIRGMSDEVEARLRQKIVEQQQTIDRILARQSRIFSLFAKHAIIDLDEDDPSIGDATHGSNPDNDVDAEADDDNL